MYRFIALLCCFVCFLQSSFANTTTLKDYSSLSKLKPPFVPLQGFKQCGEWIHTKKSALESKSFEAIKNDDVVALKKLIRQLESKGEQRYSYNALNKEGFSYTLQTIDDFSIRQSNDCHNPSYSMLEWAVLFGQVKTISYLLDSGADIHAQMTHWTSGTNAIDWAKQSGNDMLAVLLESKTRAYDTYQQTKIQSKEK